MHHPITISQGQCPPTGSVYLCWAASERLPRIFLIRNEQLKDYRPLAMCIMSNTQTAFIIKQTVNYLSKYMLMSYYFGIVNLILRGAYKFFTDYSSIPDLEFLRVGIFNQGGNL